MPPVTLNLTALRLAEIPPDDAVISAARALIDDSLSWKLGGVHGNGTVQTAHAVLADGTSWHARASRHALPFDPFWALLGHQWMPAKKAFNDAYIHEIKKMTLVKRLSPTAAIWTAYYVLPPPVSPRVFTVLQITHLDTAAPRTGWVVHMPVDLTGPGDQELLVGLEERGVKGRYACVEKITELPDGRTEWRLVTANTPAGLIPKALADKALPARIALDVTSFMDWYYTSYVKTHKIEADAAPPASGYSLATIGWSLALLNVAVYVTLYHTSFGPRLPVRTILAAIWGPGLCAIYARWTKPDLKDMVPKNDRLLIGMRDSMIPATIELAEPLPLEKLTALITARLLAIPRMTHRLVVPSAAAPYWEPTAKMDVAAHVREHTLPAGSGYVELRALIEQLGRKSVDPARPPWEIALIHLPEGGSVLFTRVHHAIADGRGVTDLLMACADESRAALMPLAASRSAPASSLLSRAAQTVRNIKDLRNLDIPQERLSSIKRAEPLETVAMAWVQRPLALVDLKRVAARLGGGTVNDVVLAAVAGALRRYMDGQGDDVDKRAVYVKVPVDRFARAAGTADVVLGTHLGDFNAPLPTDVGTAAGRYERVRATTRAAKAGYRVGLAASMSGVVGGLAMPTRLALIATDAKTVSCYVSNMKGPAAPMHLVGGIPVVNVRCHPLGLNNIGVGFAVYSYAGHVNVAVCTDKQLIPDPDVLCGFLEDELRELAAASLRSRVAFLPQPPKFSSARCVVLESPMEDVMPVLFPVDAAAISRFLVGTRDASLKLAADFIHHSTDYVRLDVRAACASDALPLLSALEPCGKDDGEGEGDGADHARAPMLQRDCFTVIERVPVLLGLVNQTVTVKSWQVLDPAQRVAAYEIVVQGAGVRVWKMRELEDLGGDEAGTRRTRVSETLRGVCPWVLQGVVSKDSAKTQRDAMDKYAAMIGAL